MSGTTYLGLPADRGLNAFNWKAPVEGRRIDSKKTAPKSAADILAFKVAGSITFSKNTQADADKTAKLSGRKNHSRSQ